MTQDQLLAQNAQLLHQLQEQQRIFNFRNIYTNTMLMNPYMQSQVNQESKKIKKTQSTLKTTASTASIKEQVQSISDIKGNVKNAYIKKITSLLSVEGENLIDEELQEDLENESSFEIVVKGKFAGLLGSTNDLLGAEQKNKKLKKSAKKSRLRKKVYQKLLEKKVQELDSQVEEYKATTRKSFEFLTQVLSSHPILNSMIIENSRMNDQVRNCKEVEQAQLILDSYLMRYGTTGIKRKGYTKYAIKNIQKNFLKGNYSLQLVGWDQNNVKSDVEFNQYVEAVKQYAQIEDENLIYKVLPAINRILDHRKNAQQLLLKLNQETKQFQSVQCDFEETINSFTQALTPIQHLELIKAVEKNGAFNRFSI